MEQNQLTSDQRRDQLFNEVTDAFERWKRDPRNDLSISMCFNTNTENVYYWLANESPYEDLQIQYSYRVPKNTTPDDKIVKLLESLHEKITINNKTFTYKKVLSEDGCQYYNISIKLPMNNPNIVGDTINILISLRREIERLCGKKTM